MTATNVEPSESSIDAPALQAIRLRLPHVPRFLWVLRGEGSRVDNERFPGAEPVLTRQTAVAASWGWQALLRENAACGQLAGEKRGPVLTIDVQRACRWLDRGPSNWGSELRGIVFEFDNLLWDSAATLGDTAWATDVAHESGWHSLYKFVSSDLDTGSPPSNAGGLWRAMVHSFCSRLAIPDRAG